jgi:hypothetical protein
LEEVVREEAAKDSTDECCEFESESLSGWRGEITADVVDEVVDEEVQSGRPARRY